MDLAGLDALLLDHRVKGMPGGVAPFPLGAIGERKWNVLREDLPLPLAVLKESALAGNSAWMQRFLGASGAAISPHGKTTMSPQLFARQLADGAWGMTVATVHQAQVARDFGVRRVVLANQLVGRQAIRYVLDELRRDPDFDFYCLVDSAANVAALAAAARAAEIGRPLQVLLEGGSPGGRTGCRTLAEALDVARAVSEAAPYLALRGVEGFEGLFHGATADETAGQVAVFLDFLVAIAVACERDGLFAPGIAILSAGGSAFYDMVAARFRDAGITREFLVLTRSGCYLTHDSVLYRDAFADLRRRSPDIEAFGPGLQPALEVWAYVQSRPEPRKVLLTMGKRDVSFDEMPVALRWCRPGEATPREVPEGHVVTGLNDQHCHMTVPTSSPLQVGDMVGFGISHPCLTFDKWQVLCIVDDEYTVTEAIKTFF
ncbi:MAG TPA: amino acid deaminase [Stellaceae bacterium]|jgi:D-serine dehydratase|nr:amino acid deaminase [Stellaceae bacterium]